MCRNLNGMVLVSFDQDTFLCFFIAADMLSDTEIVKDHAGLYGPFLRAGKVSKRSAASVLARRFECERAHDFVSEGHEVRGLQSKGMHAKRKGKVSKRSAASVLARRFECERAHDFVSEGHEVRGLQSKGMHAKRKGKVSKRSAASVICTQKKCGKNTINKKEEKNERRKQNN